MPGLRRHRPRRGDACDDGAMPDLELIDCGDGRRLERFGAVTVDRPAPAATIPASRRGVVAPRAALGEGRLGPRGRRRSVAGACRRPRAGVPALGRGQVGVFPEHAATWAWLDDAVRAAEGTLGRPPEVLSLFGYTGGASLACASAGARVAHVDASKPAVAWARRNAELSGLGGTPVRWLVDDARAFVRRERRRGRRYDGVVLDPPSYGHGMGAWRIDEDLPALLEDLAALSGRGRPSWCSAPHAGLRRRPAGGAASRAPWRCRDRPSRWRSRPPGPRCRSGPGPRRPVR